MTWRPWICSLPVGWLCSSSGLHVSCAKGSGGRWHGRPGPTLSLSFLNFPSVELETTTLPFLPFRPLKRHWTLLQWPMANSRSAVPPPLLFFHSCQRKSKVVFDAFFPAGILWGRQASRRQDKEFGGFLWSVTIDQEVSKLTVLLLPKQWWQCVCGGKKTIFVSHFLVI